MQIFFFLDDSRADDDEGSEYNETYFHPDSSDNQDSKYFQSPIHAIDHRQTDTFQNFNE